jgi:transposase
MICRARLFHIILRDADESQIQRWLTAFGTPQQVALRSRIVLASAAGESDSAIAERLDTNRKTVMLWRNRFAHDGLESLWEVAPGRGRKPAYCVDKIQEIIDTTLQTKPKGMTQWSCRLLAAQLGVSKSTVNTVWRSHNLKPHPRFVLHFIPTSFSWLNLVERWFGELTSKRIRRGVFFSVEDLKKAIDEFLRAWNEKPKPFVWIATVESIVEKLARCRRTLENIKPGCTSPRSRKSKK